MNFMHRLALFALLTPVLGRADVIVLKNADRLTGEIQKLESNALVLKTDYAGNVRIAWNMVDRITSDRTFEIEVENGMRLTGAIQESEEDLLIATDDDLVTLAQPRVVSMKPIEEDVPRSRWNNLSGAIDLGYSLARGNSDLNQSSVNLASVYRTAKNIFKVDLSSLFSRQEDTATTSRHAASFRHDHNLNVQAFTFLIAGFERDDRRLLDLRSNLGGGLGWKLIKSERTDLSLLGGFTYLNENFRPRPGSTDPVPRTSSSEGLGGLDLSTSIGRIRLTTRLSIHPNFIDTGRYRVTYESGLRMPLIGRFTWNINLFDRFDSRPPLAVLRNDYGIVSSFGFTY